MMQKRPEKKATCPQSIITAYENDKTSHPVKKKVRKMGDSREIEESLYEHTSEIIETRKKHAFSYANREVSMMYWEIGRYIGSVLLGNERAEYGKRIVTTLSQQLVERYGSSFGETNIKRMIKFARLFPDPVIPATVSQESRDQYRGRGTADAGCHRRGRCEGARGIPRFYWRFRTRRRDYQKRTQKLSGSVSRR
jgi:hypothetical protein